MDITNEAPVTQFELKRVGVRDQPHVDQCLREVARRLLGGRPGAAPLPEERLDPLMPAQAAAWVATANYLNGRIQGEPSQKPGRTPDLSTSGAAAMKAVLHEVGRIGSHTLWDPLETLMKHMEGDSNLSTEANGAAAAFDHDARWEAASKLIRNRENVLMT